MLRRGLRPRLQTRQVQISLALRCSKAFNGSLPLLQVAGATSQVGEFARVYFHVALALSLGLRFTEKSRRTALMAVDLEEGVSVHTQIRNLFGLGPYEPPKVEVS